MVTPSAAMAKAMTPASAAQSPSTARAGHQKALVVSGAWDSIQFDCNAAKRDRLPAEKMAAICKRITNAAPITAATIWAISLVRLAPMMRNNATVSASAAAVATAPIAATTPYAE